MYAKLFGKSGKFTGRIFIITDESAIGRSPENPIQLSSGIISNQHARIFFDEAKNAFFIEDLNNKNGTSVDKKLISGRAQLGETHIITIAKIFDFIFSASDKPVPAELQAAVAQQTKASAFATSTRALESDPIFDVPDFLKATPSKK